MERTDIINNSTPLNRFTGINDFPGEPLAPRAPQFPLHCPLVPLLTKKGTTKKIYPSGAERALIYGVESFDPMSSFWNESNMLSNKLMATGNIHATQRVKPADAPAPANVTIYMDIIKDEAIPNYKRNSDGSYVKDEFGDIEEDGVVTGYRVKYFSKTFPLGMNVGLQGILNGTMEVDSGELDDDSLPIMTASKMYPIMDIPAKEFGSFYANIGMKISPVVGTALKSKFLSDGKFLPFEISIFERENPSMSGVVKKTMSGGASTTVSFKQNSRHPYTEGILDVDLQFPHNWYNEDPSKPAIKYYDIDNIHFYYENLQTVLDKFIETEKVKLSSVETTWDDAADAATLDWFDFTNDTDISEEAHLFNWVTLKSSGKQINYMTVVKDNSTVVPVVGSDLEEITIGNDSILYLRGGGDGTLSIDEIQKYIKATMNFYLDSDSEVQSLVMNKETGIYDIGYDLETKKTMANMLAVRPDTIVHWCTHQLEYGDTPMSTDDEYAVALALLARAEIFPESEIFATSVCRATIIMGSMEDKDSVAKKRYTQNYELAVMLGEYLGASAGFMKPLKCLDNGRANTILTLGKNYTPDFIPDSFKQTIWTHGITYSEPYKINQRAFLAIRSIHNNEQSILTSPILLYLNNKICRIMDDAHKEFSGNEKDTNEVFANNMVAFMNTELEGVIDNGRFNVDFEVIFDEGDLKRKYSYRVIAHISGNVMKTAQVSTVATYAN